MGNWHTYTFGLDHPTGDCTAVADSTSPLYSGRRLSAEEAAAAKAGEASAAGRSSGSVPYSHSSSDSGKKKFSRAVDLHSFFGDPDPAVFLTADPDTAVFLNADPDPALKTL